MFWDNRLNAAATLGTAQGWLMLFFWELLRASPPGTTPGSVPRTAALELTLPGISWAQAAPVLPAVKTPSPKLYGKAQTRVFVTATFVL